MASKYPGDLDTDAELPRAFDNISETGTEVINAIRDAIIAIERTVGTDPQGTMSSLSARLDAFLNPNGTIKSSAFSAAGLVSLPVVNADIGASAAIEESKLDLDFATADLKLDIDSHTIDIASLQDLQSNLLSNFNLHTYGAYGNHDGYDVTNNLLSGVPATSTVSGAIHYQWQEFLAHKSATVAGEHNASAISYVPDADSIITATNVQDALSQVDISYIEDRRKHNDLAHSDGVSNDGYSLYGGQGAVPNASICPVRYTPPSGANRIKLGLINAATVKSKGFAPTQIDNSNIDAVDIVFTTGSTSRTANITGLYNASYPVAGRVSIQGIVSYLNEFFADGYYPGTAFESDGEIIVQHNIARDDCFVGIYSPVANSAVSALGLSAVDGIDVGRVSNNIFTVNGKIFTEIPEIVSGAATQISFGSVVDLGVDVGATGKNLKSGMLLHIYDHSNGNCNGTYVIQSVSASPGTTVSVNFSIDAGTYEYVIYHDTFQFEAGSAKRSYDLHLDSDGYAISNKRAELTVSQISGLGLVEVSQDFPVTTGMLVHLRKQSSTYELTCEISGAQGQITYFTAGYTGYVTVYAPNNISYLKYYVYDLAPPSLPYPSAKTDTIDTYVITTQDDNILVGATYFNGTSILWPTCLRSVGLTSSNAISDEFKNNFISEPLADLRRSGIVRGFDVSIGSPATDIDITGGRAYINGKQINVETATVRVTNVAITDGTWNVVLTDQGRIEIYSESDASHTLAQLLSYKDVAAISQVIVSGGLVTAVTDARLFINNVDDKLSITVDARNLGSGTFRTIESALLYASNTSFSSKPDISILSQWSQSSALTISADTRIKAYNDFTVSNDLAIESGAILECWGTLSCTGTLLINGGKVIAHGPVSAADIEIAANGALFLEDSVGVSSVVISGSNTKIWGDSSRPTMLFDGSDNGVTVDSGLTGIDIRNIDFEMTSSVYDCLVFSGTLSDLLVDNCSFHQSSVLSTVEAAIPTSRAAIRFAGSNTNAVSNVQINNCVFYNVSVIAYSTSSISGFELYHAWADMFGSGIYIDGADAVDLEVYDGYFAHAHSYIAYLVPYANIPGGIRNFKFSDNSVIGVYDLADLVFKGIYAASGAIDDSEISNNYWYDITTQQRMIDIASRTPFMMTGNKFVKCYMDSDFEMIKIYHGSSVAEDSVSAISNNIFQDISGILFAGSRVLFTDNICNVVDGGGTSSGNPTYISALNVGVVTDNIITLPSNGVVQVQGVFSDNTAIISQLIITPAVGAAEYLLDESCKLSDNSIRITPSTLSSGIVCSLVDGITSSDTEYPAPIIFTNNTIWGSSLVNLVHIENTSLEIGRLNFSNNNITSDGAVANIVHIDFPNNSIHPNNVSSIHGNTITTFEGGASATTGFRIVSANTNIASNIIRGNFVSEAMHITGLSDSWITDNFIGGGGAGSTNITMSSAHTNVLYRNKNFPDYYTYSPIGEHTVGTWTLDSADGYMMKNTTANAELFVSLDQIPAGARIKQIDVYLYGAGPVGSVRAELRVQNDIYNAPFSNNIVTLGATSTGYALSGPLQASSAAASSNQKISLVPASTLRLKNNQTCSILLRLANTGNKIGQVVAQIIY